jgi:hypothetical protein
MGYKEKLYNIQYLSFTIFIYLTYFVYITYAIGISKTIPTFLIDLNNYVRIYICLFLIWRFNPFKSKYEFTDLDRRIAFSAGLFILTTTVVNIYVVNTYLEKIKKIGKMII